MNIMYKKILKLVEFSQWRLGACVQQVIPKLPQQTVHYTARGNNEFNRNRP